MSSIFMAMSGMATATTERSEQEIAQAVVAEFTQSIQPAPERRGNRTSRRPTSHYNAFQTSCHPSTDSPPSYASVIKRPLNSSVHPQYGMEKLPGYSCSVASEGKVWYQLESYNPLNGASESSWKEIYVTLRGTLLQLCRIKDEGPGKPFRTYNLQHAEVGLATDTAHTVLIPQTRLAHLIPSRHRQRAWQKDEKLFQPSKQTILRLRAETDQFLFAHESEERIFQWVNSLSAAIDIAPAIDERSIPRQCTVPRRRRRRTAQDSNDVEDPALRAEQERMWRSMYPGFADRTAEARPDLSRSVTEDAVTIETRQNAARDDDEIDIAMMREDLNTLSMQQSHVSTLNGGARPMVSRQTSADTIASAVNHNSQNTPLATSPINNFSSDGKWEPSHPRSSAQTWRYIRRCMPVLLIDAARASDVTICHGHRVKINWRMVILEEWELKPPSYRSHKFNAGVSLERSISQLSEHATDQAKSDSQANGSCNESCLEQVEPVETANGNYDLTKINSTTRQPGATYTSGPDIPSVIFCF